MPSRYMGKELFHQRKQQGQRPQTPCAGASRRVAFMGEKSGVRGPSHITFCGTLAFTLSQGSPFERDRIRLVSNRISCVDM